MKNTLFFNLYIFFLFLKSSGSTENCSQCLFSHHHKSTDTASIERLKGLCGKRFHTNAPDGSIFSYYLGICTSALLAETRHDFLDVGLVQKDSSNSKTFKLGSIKKADLKMGTNWMMLEYAGGEEYSNNVCNNQARKATIFLLCDPAEQQGRLEYLEEDNGASAENCYYLFQLTHQSVCRAGGGGGGETDAVDSGDWSIGSIVCFILLTTTAAYFGIGFVFMRLVRKQRGLKQIPHFDFWRELGHLQADGCNLVCRCADRHVNNYSGDIQREDSATLPVYEDGYN